MTSNQIKLYVTFQLTGLAMGFMCHYILIACYNVVGIPDIFVFNIVGLMEFQMAAFLCYWAVKQAVVYDGLAVGGISKAKGGSGSGIAGGSDQAMKLKGS